MASGSPLVFPAHGLGESGERPAAAYGALTCPSLDCAPCTIDKEGFTHMRTPIIVRSGSLELLTARPLAESQSGPRFVYRLRGSQGGAAVDTFEISNCKVHVKDDSDVGERGLEVWLTGTPAGSPALTVDTSSRGLKVTTDRPLTRRTKVGGRPFLYVYEADASQYSYNLHGGGAARGGGDLAGVAFR